MLFRISFLFLCSLIYSCKEKVCYFKDIDKIKLQLDANSLKHLRFVSKNRNELRKAKRLPFLTDSFTVVKYSDDFVVWKNYIDRKNDSENYLESLSIFFNSEDSTQVFERGVFWEDYKTKIKYVFGKLRSTDSEDYFKASRILNNDTVAISYNDFIKIVNNFRNPLKLQQK